MTVPDERREHRARKALAYLGLPPHNDTEPSIEAADKIATVVNPIRRAVFAQIVLNGCRGATADEVQVALTLSHSTATARLWELEKRAGLIARSKTVKRPTRSGVNAGVYLLTPLGETLATILADAVLVPRGQHAAFVAHKQGGANG